MSPRPKHQRHIARPPMARGFKPIGKVSANKDYVMMTMDEFEALRLADYKNLSQLEASGIMNISRPTFTRIYDSALKKVARAFTEIKCIQFTGGTVSFAEEWFHCNHCGENFKLTGKRIDHPVCPLCYSPEISNLSERKYPDKTIKERTKQNPAGGFYVCPKCRIKLKHHVESGLSEHVFCPECGIRMRKYRKSRKDKGG